MHGMELLRSLVKPREFAPGIPSKSTIHPIPEVEKPVKWEFGVHAHHSVGAAGEHMDLRLGDPDTGHAHSWAMKNWPKPGQPGTLAVMQPTHTVDYMDFQGRIESGYGKGNVRLARRDKAEVLSSSTGHVRFNVYDGKNVEEYLLRKPTQEGNDWMLHNVTRTRDAGPGAILPSSKPAYKVKEPEKVDPGTPGTVLQAKIDGAHVVYDFGNTGRQMRAYSYRPAERDTGLINHTYKLPKFHKMKTPTFLRNTTFRGELYAVGSDGKALPAERVGGILNAGVWKSREKQKEEGKLVPVVFDVTKWKSKDVSKEPYSVKLDLLRQAVKAAPWLKLPRTAETPKDKARLLKDIERGREPSTQEGVVEWDLTKPVPTKAKFRNDTDVYVKEVFREISKSPGRTPMAGGFSYSLTPKGPIVGKVGTGFSHELKKDLAERPELYKGLLAKVKMQRGHAGRAPSFQGWHLDQELPEGVKTAAPKVVELTDPDARAEAIMLQYSHFWPKEYKRRLEKGSQPFLPPRHNKLFGVYEGDELVGALRVNTAPKMDWKKDTAFGPAVRKLNPEAGLSSIVVKPEHRGKGIARALLEHSQGQYGSLLAGTGHLSNKPAMTHTLTDLGFKKVHEHRGSTQWAWDKQKAKELGVK